MEKKIVKRNTFKEAFADVLKMSHEELIRHSIDPFIREAFGVFNDMDFSYKHIDYRFILNSWVDTYSSYKSITYQSNKYFLYAKEFSLDDAVINKIYMFDEKTTSRDISYLDILSDSIQHEADETISRNENEVQQWLLAA